MHLIRHITAIPLALLATLCLTWLMKVLIETRSVENTFEQPPARIVYISNDLEEINNPIPPAPSQPEQPEEPDPEPEVKPEPPRPEPKPIVKPVESPVEKTEQKHVVPVQKPKPQQKKKPKRKSRPKKAARAKFDSRPLYRPKPTYPSSARRRGLEGYVTVRYTITKMGSVRDIHIVSSRPSGIFNTAAINAVKRWRYKPQPVDRRGITSKIRFVLRGRR